MSKKNRKPRIGIEPSNGTKYRDRNSFFYIFFGNIEFKARKIIYNAIHYTMFDLNVCGVSMFALKSRMKQLIKQHKSTSHRVIFFIFRHFRVISCTLTHSKHTHTHPSVSPNFSSFCLLCTHSYYSLFIIFIL